MTFGRTTARVTECGYDKLGRWAYQVLNGDSRQILIMNIYQCCEVSSTSNGILTACQQQRILLREQNKSLEPREHFQKDLIDFLWKQRRANGNIVPILMGDWNDVSDSTELSRELKYEFGLVDVFC